MVPLLVGMVFGFALPINLDTVTIERARTLNGKVVVATFLVAKPSYTLFGKTMIGAADRDDGVERGAVLTGRRFDIEEGKRVVVIGMMKVLRHRADFVSGVFVTEWFEIRVSQ